MEKDTGHFCYDPYPAASKENTNSLKRDVSKKKKEEKSCCCFGRKAKKRSKAFLAGLATNLGICVLLFGYTLIGSVIFLSIEGGTSYQHQILAATSQSTNINDSSKRTNHSAELKAKADEARAKTVENIWDITVSLNILYRDNWTRLAAQEITRFQEDLIKSINEEMALQQPLQVAKYGGKHVVDNHEWSFAKAFLYSLTVLTTIALGVVEMEPDSVLECFLCKEGVVDDVVIVTRGLENLIRVSKERCDNLHLFLQKQSSVRIHNKCRDRYIIKSRGKFAYNEFDKHSSRRLEHLTSSKRQKKRSHSGFDFQNNCLFCQLPASIEIEKRKNCSCLKAGLKCSSICDSCQLTQCSNYKRNESIFPEELEVEVEIEVAEEVEGLQSEEAEIQLEEERERTTGGRVEMEQEGVGDENTVDDEEYVYDSDDLEWLTTP